MSIVCFGVSHHSAPLGLLEKLSFSNDQMAAFLGELRAAGQIGEVAGLSTCNRTEFYLASRDHQGARRALLERLTAARRGSSLEELQEFSYTHRNEPAVGHLLRVAAGVDSLIVGEAQILGQLRRSYELALNAGSIGGMLNSLLLRALGFGRRVRLETGIGRGSVSFGSIALRLASAQFADLSTRRLLVMGAGETAQLAARAFVKEGIGGLGILNRTVESAREFAGELGGEALSMEQMESAIESADVIVCAVGAPHYIMTADGLRRIVVRRASRPLLVIDLSMPRNVEPAAAEVPGVVLHSLESLEMIAEENRQQRQSEVALVEIMIASETADFMRSAQSSCAGKLATAIRRRAEEARRARLERYCRDLPEAERERIARFSDSLLRSVLHDVTLNIRSIDVDSESGARDFETLCRLFNVTRQELED